MSQVSASERTVAELESANAVVIDMPMHNFTVPSALKTWIDYVARKNSTFRSTPTCKAGLLRLGKVGRGSTEAEQALAVTHAWIEARLSAVTSAPI